MSAAIDLGYLSKFFYQVSYAVPDIEKACAQYRKVIGGSSRSMKSRSARSSSPIEAGPLP